MEKIQAKEAQNLVKDYDAEGLRMIQNQVLIHLHFKIKIYLQFKKLLMNKGLRP